jgi:signal transduction histidine kinase
MTVEPTIDQLEQQLADSEASGDVPLQIASLNALAWVLSDIDLHRAYALGEAAYALASAPADGAPPDSLALAYSLRVQGYVNQRLGDYPRALAQLLKAQDIFESRQVLDGLADVLDVIAGVYYHISDYPDALNLMLRQLAIAQQLGDQRRIANAYNNLGAVYHETGEAERSFEIHQHNLQLAVEIDYPRMEFLASVNLAENYWARGDYDQALQHALRAQRVSEASGFELLEVYARDFVGRAYLALGQTEQAIAFLEQALTMTYWLEAKAPEAQVLQTMAEVYREMRQLDRAVEHLQQSVVVAEAIDEKVVLTKGLLLLSQVYEQQGDQAQALAYLKQYNLLQERVLGDKAAMRWQVLQVAHDTATARQEAEILRLKAQQLEQEIQEHAQSELRLQRQMEFMQALSTFKEALLAPAESEADSHRILTNALQHLLKPSQANTITLQQNFTDLDLGHYSQLIAVVAETPSLSAEAEATLQTILTEFRQLVQQSVPRLAAQPDGSVASVFPWSVVPAEVTRRLATGSWVGGSVEELYAAAPELRDFLLLRHQLQWLLMFPIHVSGQWWGTITMIQWDARPTGGEDDEASSRANPASHIQWTEDELLLFGAAAEMLASTVQRWQVKAKLRSLNEQLEQQVEARTAELNNTIVLLQQEIAERERAEAETQQVLQTLEQRVADRTEELATFFDLTLLAGQGISLPEVLKQVLPQLTEITRSEAVGIDLFDADRGALQLIAKQNLPEDIPTLWPIGELPLEFQRWLQRPNDPLNTPDLASMPALRSAFHAAGLHTYLGAQIRIGQRIEGVLICFRFTEGGYSVDETALILALAHQIGIILEIDRLREKAEAIAVLEERQRLARDLHDSVTQSLYSLSLFSRSAREAADDGDTIRLKGSLTELERNTLNTLREMRLLLYELRPADLEQEGLKRAIELRLNAVERRANLQLDVQVDEVVGLSSDQEVELYHIVVEALNNVIKHAAATRVSLQLTQVDGRLHLRIADDGQGFDPTQVTGGMGLNNIRERVARLGGQFTICNEPGGGTCLEAVIPDRVEES